MARVGKSSSRGRNKEETEKSPERSSGRSRNRTEKSAEKPAPARRTSNRSTPQEQEKPSRTTGRSKKVEAKTSPRASSKTRGNTKKSARVEKQSSKSASREDRKLSIEDRKIDQQNKMAKNMIIAALIIVICFSLIIFVPSIMLGQKIEKLKQLVIEPNVALEDAMKLAPMISISESGDSALEPVAESLDNAIATNDIETVKLAYIAALASVYKRNPTINEATGLKQLKDIADMDSGITRQYALGAMAFVPSGATTLQEFLQSDNKDPEAGLAALEALKLLKEVPTSALISALSRNDSDFILKTLELAMSEDNVNRFREEVFAVREVLKKCGHPDDEVRNKSKSILEKIVYKPEHYKSLVNACNESNLNVKKTALDALTGLPVNQAGKYWIGILQSPQEKKLTQDMISKFGNPECKEYLQDLIKLLNHPDDDIKVSILKAIEDMKLTSLEALSVLYPYMNNESSKLRIASISTLASFKYERPYLYIQKKDYMPHPMLIKLLSDKEPGVQEAAQKALGKLSKRPNSSKQACIDWWAKEKSVLDIVKVFNNNIEKLKELIRSRKFEEGKALVKKTQAIWEELFSNHSKRWSGFQNFLESKGLKLNEMYTTTAKHSKVFDSKQ